MTHWTAELSERDAMERRLNDLRAEVATAWQRYQEMSAEVARQRVEIQRYDCAHGDTPGLIHCPVERPCTQHRLAQYEAEVARLAARVAVLEADRGA